MKTQMKPLALMGTGGAVALALVLASRAGPHKTLGYALTAVDGSGSTDTNRRRQLSVTDEIVERLGTRATLAFWRYDSKVELLFENRVVKPESLWLLQDEKLKPPTFHDGSRLDLMLGESASALMVRSKQHPKEALVLVLVGDGENTGQSLAPMIARLAAIRNLRAVVFLGITSEFRSQRRSDFQSLGARYIDAGWGEASQAIRATRAKLEATNSP